MCDTQTSQQVMPLTCFDSKAQKDLSLVDAFSCTASTASDCSDDHLQEFDLDDFFEASEWQDVAEKDDELYAAIGDWVEDDLDEYIADWVEQDLKDYCTIVSEQQTCGKRVRFSEEISYVEPEDHIFEMVAYLRAERKAKKEYEKQCREYAQQWKVYMEYWQQASTQPSTPAKEEQ
jgi:hypothetical protein